MEHPPNITQLLKDWNGGDQKALDQLVPLIYDELRRAARRHMRRESDDHTLQTTALVNEAYLRLVDQKHVRWEGRAHFFALAAQVMRNILVDYARRRRYQKRGGLARRVSLEEATAVSREPGAEILALDEALKLLAEIDPRRSRVVELRFFGGLDLKETAAVLGVSPATALRDWNLAKAWLYRQLSRDGGEGNDPAR
jgi:RNA polymerase sigma-70 factor, ECF subfamily